MSDALDSEGSLGPLMADIADEFARRRRSGEPADVEDFARRHPAHATTIRQVLSSLQMLDLPQVGPGGLGRLGDFRLLREIGRGGMGVVYEAEQISLGRRVALKVLGMAATLDPRQLQRFLNEARAAAQLHHTHIVPVFGVGCARGTHFYAMQYVEGTNLAAIIAQMRQEAGSKKRASTETRAAWSTQRDKPRELFRWVARLGAQAAQALEHAHAQGVVHRDVKPSNLLLDNQGALWVTDFGLARFQSAPGLTATGDLLGTLRYMSPEQALGKPALTDHRTDVYSLGLTLYELVTLAPAFAGSDRQAVLRQIAHDDPTPPRRLNPECPVDLETILLKASAKAPEQRYASAQAFADDLGRFLEDRPIRARRPTLAQRALKWARRHRSLVVSVSASAGLLFGGAVCGTIAYALEQRRWAHESASAVAQMEEAKKQTNEKYYEALVSRAAALRLGRVPGYRAQAWNDLRTAAGLDVPNKDLAALRAEIMAGLGDPVGLGPVKAPALPRRRPPLPPHMTALLRQRQAGWPRPAVSAASADGRFFALYPDPAGIALWSRGDRVPARPLLPLGAVYDLAFTPDGRLLVAGCEEGLAVWNVPSLAPWSFVRGGNVFAVATHPSGRLLATSGRRLELWSLTSNRLLLSLEAPAHGARADFSADGKLLLALGGGGTVLKAWPVADTPEKQQLAGHHGGAPAIAFSPDGQVLATGSKDNTVKIWDARTGAMRHACLGHAAGVEALAFSPDGALVATGDVWGEIRLWDVAAGTAVARARPVVPNRIWRLQFDRDGRTLVGGGDGGVVSCTLRRQGDKVELTTLRGPALPGIIDLALRPGGDSMVVLDRTGGLHKIDLAPDARPTLLDVRARNQVRSLHFDATGQRFTFVTLEGKLATCDWGSFKVRATNQSTGTLALRSDGRCVATAGPGQGINIYDLAARHEQLHLPPEASDIWGLAWSPDGKRLALGLSDGGVAVWDLDEVRARLAELRPGPLLRRSP